MNIIGIDPGVNGGITLLTSNQLISHPMAKTEQDTFDLLSNMKAFSPDETICYLELVHSMPKQGVASTFTFGKSYGFLRGCLVALGIRTEEVSPQRWQGGLTIPKRDIKGGESQPDHKTKLLCKAQQLFPGKPFTLKTADSALIAEYGRRNENIINAKREVA